MGWLAPRHKQWLCVMRKWLRVLSMDNSFLTKKIFLHSMNQSNSSCRTWLYRVKQFLISIDQEHMFRARDLNARLVLPVIDVNLKMFYDNCWQEKLQAEFAVRGETHGGNKLRTYRTFKNTYSTEPYVRIIAQKKFRSAYAKFRSGVAPINIELCRYGLARIPVEERVCSHCNEVEDESHVLMYCPLYDNIRDQLTLSINDINPSLQDSSVQDQFIQLMSNPIYYRVVSKAICYILNKRRLIVYR